MPLDPAARDLIELRDENLLPTETRPVISSHRRESSTLSRIDQARV
jgi:hypothetical protein